MAVCNGQRPLKSWGFTPGPVGTLQELTSYCEHLEKRHGIYLAAVNIFKLADSFNNFFC